MLYWMQSTHRFEENWALRAAIRQADTRHLPLVIHQGLDPTYEHASDRIHEFILRNAGELASRADQLGLDYRFVLRRTRDEDRRVVDQLAARAAIVITDLFPTAGVWERAMRFAQRAEVRVVAVESHGIIPSGLFEREEYAARTIRPKLHRFLPFALEPVEDRPPRRRVPSDMMASLPGKPLNFARHDLAQELAHCDIDHSVPPVSLPSGRNAALRRARTFVDSVMQDYGTRRIDPTDDEGSSRLSPYLHFGQISAIEVVRMALESEHRREAEAFLNEILVWRELALNFSLRNPSYRTLDALPAWVNKTLTKHESDPRESEYSMQDFEEAGTHNDLWNAAQRELMTTGVMHNVVRMLWGKHFIAWSKRPADALAWALHLNNKYGIDGRDPSSYAGVQWCFGKFDRPFQERPVLGLVRPMSLERARKKWDVDAYVARWGDAPTQPGLFGDSSGGPASRRTSRRG